MDGLRPNLTNLLGARVTHMFDPCLSHVWPIANCEVDSSWGQHKEFNCLLAGIRDVSKTFLRGVVKDAFNVTNATRLREVQCICPDLPCSHKQTPWETHTINQMIDVSAQFNYGCLNRFDSFCSCLGTTETTETRICISHSPYSRYRKTRHQKGTLIPDPLWIQHQSSAWWSYSSFWKTPPPL